MTPSLSAEGENLAKLPPQFYLKLFFNFSHKWPTFAFTSERVYTLSFRRRIAHSGSQGETGAVSDGAAITTLGAFRTFTNIPGPGVRTAYFAALGSWPGGALEERRKPSGQRCAYACRCPEGVAAPLGCAALTVEFLAFLLLLKTTIANSLTPWYYGVTKSESIG